MDQAVNFSVTPLQAILAIGFQLWLVVFPLLILRRIDRLTRLIEERFGGDEGAEGDGASGGSEEGEN